MPDISKSSSTRNHPLFRRFAIDGTVDVALGALPKPYHVYDGHGVLIMGHATPLAVARDFEGQDVFPVMTRSGKAAMAFFVCSFTDASLGPHLELQAVALAAPQPNQRISDDPTAIAAALVNHPDWGLLSLHLWNDSKTVVAYNTDYLGLGAQIASGTVSLGQDALGHETTGHEAPGHEARGHEAPGRAVTFAFHSIDGTPLFSGRLARKAFSDVRCIFALVREMGLHTVLRMARQPFAMAHLINRKSDVLPRNARAQTITAADQLVVTRFAPKRDQLHLSGPLGVYGFTPLCHEHIAPFRFVYLHPDCPSV